MLQRYVGDMFGYWARCKRASILWDWINGIATVTIEQRYTINPFNSSITLGDIRKFADSTRFQLRAAYQIATLMLLEGVPSAEEVENLIKQLEVGIPTDALNLLSIPISLARGEYLALYHSNIKTLEDLWSVSDNHLKEILGPKRVDELNMFRPS